MVVKFSSKKRKEEFRTTIMTCFRNENDFDAVTVALIESYNAKRLHKNN